MEAIQFKADKELIINGETRLEDDQIGLFNNLFQHNDGEQELELDFNNKTYHVKMYKLSNELAFKCKELNSVLKRKYFLERKLNDYLRIEKIANGHFKLKIILNETRRNKIIGWIVTTMVVILLPMFITFYERRTFGDIFSVSMAFENGDFMMSLFSLSIPFLVDTFLVNSDTDNRIELAVMMFVISYYADVHRAKSQKKETATLVKLHEDGVESSIPNNLAIIIYLYNKNCKVYFKTGYKRRFYSILETRSLIKKISEETNRLTDFGVQLEKVLFHVPHNQKNNNFNDYLQNKSNQKFDNFFDDNGGNYQIRNGEMS